MVLSGFLKLARFLSEVIDNDSINSLRKFRYVSFAQHVSAVVNMSFFVDLIAYHITSAVLSCMI